MGIYEGKRHSGRPRNECKDNRMDLRELGCDTGGSMNLSQVRDKSEGYVRAVINLRIP